MSRSFPARARLPLLRSRPGRLGRLPLRPLALLPLLALLACDGASARGDVSAETSAEARSGAGASGAAAGAAPGAPAERQGEAPASGAAEARPGGGADAAAEAPAAERGAAGAAGGSRVQATDADWTIAAEKIEWAWNQELERLPFGDLVATLGSTFVGTAYVPQVLEAEGPERLIVNLRQLDCVTFVENVLVLARLVLTLPREALEDRDVLRSRYADELVRIRYRGGVLDGYPSRLHYFSEWIADGERKGLLRALTAELGGEPRPGAIDFMSNHPEAYRQLADPEVLGEIRAMEEWLSGATRHFIPEERIAEKAPEIRNGDVIAATSTVEGLDVAHTGFALWREGDLYLLHAPLVGSAVEISERPLAARIARIGGQDGIMVARPLAPRPRSLGSAGSE